MAAKKIDIKFDLDTKSVKIAGEDTMKLTQQVRLLKAELASGNYSQEEFDILSNKLDNVQERMEGAKARSGDLLTSLQLIPGPIGEIASKFNGAISVLQQFSKFSFADLQTQFKKTVDDVKDIGKALLKNSGITAIYTRLQDALTASYIQQGFAADVAATKARGLAAAIATTGIGLLVVALGFAVSALIDYTSGTDAATEANERFEKSLKAASDATAASTAQRNRDTNERIAQLKKEGATEEQIRKVQLEKLKGDLKDKTDQYVKAAADLEEIQITGLGDAEKQADATAKLEQEMLDLKSQIRVAEIDNETAVNKEREALRQKDAQARERANTQELKDEQDRQRKLDEARAINREAELSLMDAYDREVAERLARFIKEQNTLKEAGFKEDSEEMERLKKEFNLDMGVIDDKYNKETIQKQRDANNQLKALQASQTETLLDDAQVEVEIVKQKYADLIKEAEKNKQDTVKLKELEKAEIAKIEETAAKAEIERIADDALAANQTKLRLLELEGQALVLGTKSYAENRAEILRLTEESSLLELKKQLDTGKLTREEYEMEVTATEEKYTQLRKDLKQQERQAIGQAISASIDAFASLGNAIASSYDDEAKTSKSAFEKRKKLQVATALMSAASGLIQILTQPSTLPSPFDVIVKTANAAALAIATGANISKIKATKFEAPDGGDDKTKPAAAAKPTGVVARRAQGGFVYGDGGSMTDSIPAMLSNGEFVMNAKSAAMFSPMLTAMNDVGNLPNTSIPQSLGNQSLVDVMSQSVNNRPIKTYVTAQDMSNQQQFDRTIKSRSLI